MPREILPGPDTLPPRECVGLARTLLREISVEGGLYEAACRQLMGELRTAWQRHPQRKVRYTLLRTAAQRFRALPARSRLGPIRVELSGRHCLTVAEIRVLAGDLKFRHWDQSASPEQSLGCEVASLCCTPERCDLEFETLCVISLHALARRYERGRRDPATVRADIATLVAAHAPTLASGETDCRIACHEGHWRCEVVPASFRDGAPGRRVIAVRTFVNPDREERHGRS